LANPILADYPLTLLDCDYAKSPEWPCPADTEDAQDVYEWVLNNPQLFDKERITLGGFSAGATIALGLSVVLGEEARLKGQPDVNMGDKGTPLATPFTHPIKAVFAVYPAATWEGSRSQVIIPPESRSKPGYLLPVWFSKIVTKAHFFSPVHPSKLTTVEEQARKEELIQRPVVSPAKAGVIEDFSPIIVLITAEFDHLTRDTEALRERLRNEGGAAGVKVHGKMVKGVGHGWDEVVKKGQFGHKERVEVYDIGARMIARAGGLDLEIDA
jgi:acetyl esterase/lipase